MQDPVPAQASIVERLAPEEVIERAVLENGPVASVALFSGGHDSTVLAHRCREFYGTLAYIDTGTAVPGVRRFVEEFAEWIDKPLVVLEAGSKYRDMVLGTGETARPGVPPLGFPGPAQHNRAYNRLKERQLRVLLKQLKAGYPRSARVLYLTGVRRAESERRKARMPITSEGSIVFANPLIDWTGDMMRAYREQHDLPESDVAALLHRSGECNCGSFAAPGEREMLESLYPEWFAETIGGLEEEARKRGIPACVWGKRPSNVPELVPVTAVDPCPVCAGAGRLPTEHGTVVCNQCDGEGEVEVTIGWREPTEEERLAEAGPMCTDCQLRLEVA